MIIEIILIIVGISVAGAIVYAIYSAKKAIRDVSRAAFGTESFVEGWNKQQEELTETPKSVSGMTRLVEPQIQKDFPDFNWKQFRVKAENMLKSAFNAITKEKESLLVEASPDLHEQIRNIIQGNNAANQREIYKDIKIHRTEIAKYEQSKGRYVITLQTALEYIHYIIADKKVIRGDEERKRQTKYNVEIMYIQDETLGGLSGAITANCPNCGAPLKTVGENTICEYCGSPVMAIQTKIWSLQKYYEVDINNN